MKISNLEFLKLLPQFMQEDESVQALASAMDKLLRNDRIDTLRTWDKFSELTDKECDELAWEFDVDWYDSKLPLEEKQLSIKNALQIKQKRGTKQSVQQLANSYLGESKIIEDSSPFTFSIEVSNPTITQDIYSKFLDALEINKNIRSHLSKVTHTFNYSDGLALSSNLELYVHHIAVCGDFKCGQDVERDYIIKNENAEPLEISASSASYEYTFKQCGQIHCGENQ